MSRDTATLWYNTFMPVAKMIDEVRNYPIEDRVVLADAILQTINPVDPEVERKWVAVAQRRRGEFLLGKVNPIASADVFAEAYARVG